MRECLKIIHQVYLLTHVRTQQLKYKFEISYWDVKNQPPTTRNLITKQISEFQATNR
jgi:hypothetical protein